MSFAIIDKAIGFGHKAVTAIKPHVPTIAVVAGSVSVCAGAFFACKATLHVDEVLTEHKAMMNHIEETVKKLPEGTFTDREIKHDKLQTYAATAGKFCRLYAPAIGLGLAGFTAIFAGFGMIKKWHGLALSSVAALDEKFGKYRSGVIERYGEKVDKELAGEVINKTEKVIEEVDIDTGEVSKKSMEVVSLRDVADSDFTRIFDSTNKKWENHYLFNENMIDQIIAWYNREFGAGRIDHVFLNTILKEFGFDETGIGHFYGWTNSRPGGVAIEVTPCLKVWDRDEDEDFPMLIPMDLNDDMDKKDFEQAYIDDENSVCYIMEFLVDTDENGVPRQIYNEVYGK